MMHGQQNVEPNIVNYIKIKRLALAGHLMGMDNNRTLKKILGVKNWKKVALNRDEWAKLLKKARAHQGLSSQ